MPRHSELRNFVNNRLFKLRRIFQKSRDPFRTVLCPIKTVFRPWVSLRESTKSMHFPIAIIFVCYSTLPTKPFPGPPGLKKMISRSWRWELDAKRTHKWEMSLSRLTHKNRENTTQKNPRYGSIEQAINIDKVSNNRCRILTRRSNWMFKTKPAPSSRQKIYR